MNIKSSNCSTKCNINNNLSKYSFFKYTQPKLTKKLTSKNNIKIRARTSKPSPLKNNSKNNHNKYIITNYNNDYNNTPKIIFNINFQNKEGNSNNKKSSSKENILKPRMNKTKQKVNYNGIKDGNNGFSSPSSIHNAIIRSKEKKFNNQITNIKKINTTNNGLSTEGNSSLLSTKTTQLGVKYINNIMKKINLDNFRKTYHTVKHSKKNSQEKKNYINKNKTKKNNTQKTNSNSKINLTSTTKIKNILINNNYNYKHLLSKYSVLSHLTTQTNHYSNNTQTNTKQINQNNNPTQLSKSYAYNKYTLETNSNKNNFKLITKNNLDSIVNNSVTYKKLFNKGCNNNLNIIYNLFPMTSTHISGKNKIKKITPKTKNINISKIKSNSANTSKNKLNQTINKDYEKKTLNNYVKTNKNYTGVNTKIMNKLSNKIKYLFTKNDNLILRKNPITTLTSFIERSESKIKISKSLNKIKKELILIDKENNTSLSISSIKDFNYYKNESKKLIDYIKNYNLKNNNNEYPKTTLDFYKIGRSIGHGAFGKVNIALHILSGHIVAIKSFNKLKNKFPRHKILAEIKLMKKLRNHKNIIKLFEYLETETYFCIIMENIPGGNLLNIINKMSKIPEKLSKYIFKQLIEGIKYIQNQGIVHRDIKPDNILIDLNNTIKICDFGVSKEVKQNQLLKDSCGTPAFVAPEILLDSPYDPFKCDIWSSGVVLYTMLSGVVPFRGNNDHQLHKSILSGKFTQLNDISIECQDLISKLLEVNPNKRIKIDNILSHKWFKDSYQKDFVLFTNAEKIIYSKLKVDYRNANKEDLVENFTYKNMESELEDENKNVNSTSFIITPYNSMINQYYDDIYYEDLRIEDNIMRFVPKVNELNRDYEIKNNEDVDQGFIINKKDQKGKNRIMLSFNNSYDDNNFDNKNDKKEIENSPKKINEIENSFDEEKKNNKKTLNYTISTNSNTFYIDEMALKFVENFGYKRDYIVRCLENNELNHATATYFLKLSLQNE